MRMRLLDQTLGLRLSFLGNVSTNPAKMRVARSLTRSRETHDPSLRWVFLQSNIARLRPAAGLGTGGGEA